VSAAQAMKDAARDEVAHGAERIRTEFTVLHLSQVAMAVLVAAQREDPELMMIINIEYSDSTHFTARSHHLREFEALC
jgi:hypothetical protein